MILLQQLISGITLGGLYALVALAFTLVIGVVNFLNFSIPGLFMLAGMTSFGLMTVFRVPWALAAAAGVAAAIVASLVVERFTYRYMRVRFGDASEHAIPLVSSIGFLILLQSLTAIWLGTGLRSFPTPWTDPNLRFGGLIVSIPNVASLALALGAVAALSAFLRWSDTGRALRAIAESPESAAYLGIAADRLVPLVFAVTGAFAGLAGILFALNYQQVSSGMGDEIAPAGIASLVIGGLGNVWGAIAGGLLIGVLQVLATYFIGARFVTAVVWGALLLILLVRPQGLFGDRAVAKGKF